jgi:hypothetical protein
VEGIAPDVLAAELDAELDAPLCDPLEDCVLDVPSCDELVLDEPSDALVNEELPDAPGCEEVPLPDDPIGPEVVVELHAKRTRLPRANGERRKGWLRVGTEGKTRAPAQ